MVARLGVERDLYGRWRLWQQWLGSSTHDSRSGNWVIFSDGGFLFLARVAYCTGVSGASRFQKWWLVWVSVTWCGASRDTLDLVQRVGGWRKVIQTCCRVLFFPIPFVYLFFNSSTSHEPKMEYATSSTKISFKRILDIYGRKLWEQERWINRIRENMGTR